METSLRPGDESFTNVLSKTTLEQKIIHQQRGNDILRAGVLLDRIPTMGDSVVGLPEWHHHPGNKDYMAHACGFQPCPSTPSLKHSYKTVWDDVKPL